jgi:hypothetical protein
MFCTVGTAKSIFANWGTWQEMRVATETDKQEFKRAGMYPMPNDRALAILGQLNSNDRTSAIVASVDWDTLRGVYQARRARPRFSEILPSSREQRPLADSEVVTPHKDVASGRYQQAEFAADLWQVHLGEGTDEYKKPVEFFRRTYLTESLKRLLVSAVQRISG